jgi:hypothetical protein
VKVFVFLGALALIFIGMIWKGFVLTILWAWFMIPTFGLPTLEIVPAIGLLLIASYLTHQAEPYKKETTPVKEKIYHGMALTFLVPLFALGIGWAVQSFM